MSWPRPLASARRTEGARSVAPCFASQGVHGWDNRLSLEIFTRRLLWQQQSYVKTIIDEALRTPSAAVPRSPSAPAEDKHCRMLPTPPGTPRSVIDHQLDDAQGDAIVRQLLFDDMDLDGKVVLTRVDVTVPVEGGPRRPPAPIERPR